MRTRLRIVSTLLLYLLLGGVGNATAGATRQGIAVTIDDLPFVHVDQFDEERLALQTTRLLDALTRTGVKAVGFVNEHKLYQLGVLDASRVALLQQWLNAGMELGNHTYSHLSLNSSGSSAFEADILRGERITRPLMEKQGQPLRYFRHPFLHVGRNLQERQEVERFLGEHGYTVAPVTIISQEWQFGAAYDNALSMGDEAVLPRIGQAYIEHMQQAIAHAESLAREMFGRNIPQVLLLHANMLNADYFPALAELIEKCGYRFVSLDEVLQDRAYRSRDTYTEADGDSWLGHWLLSAGIRPAPTPSSPDFIRQLAGTRGYRGD